MFRDQPILETLKLVASSEQWAVYEPLRAVDPPQLWGEDSPGQLENFAARERVEAEILIGVRSRLELGYWEATGRWNDAPAFTAIDPLFWRQLEFALPYGRVWQIATKNYFSDLLVSEVRSRIPSTQGDKEKLRRDLVSWFAQCESAGLRANSKSHWFASAKVKFPTLTQNLFNAVWARLGHPHPLKFDGRPEAEGSEKNGVTP